MPINKVLILGGGIAGISAALALRKLSEQSPDIHINVTVYEIRPSPSTIGGAINLTPNALRYLEHLNVLPKLESRGCPVPSIEIFSHRTGAKLGALIFKAKDDVGHAAMRIQRGELLDALLQTAQDSGIEIKFNKKATNIELDENRATVSFADREVVEGDLLLGCDGIHSFVRSAIEPERGPTYSGIATAYGILGDDGSIRQKLPLEATGIWSSRRGSFFVSWVDPGRTQLYVAAVMETAEVASREGWKLKGADSNAVRTDLLERFHTDTLPYLGEIVKGVKNFTLYPVFKLPPQGKWSSGCALLLGDAAHAMPPQGESLGFAIEDTILFTRVVERYRDRPTAEIFSNYERLRKPRIDAAFVEANSRWDNVRDKGWLASVALDWVTTWYLWWMQEAKLKDFANDVRDADL